MSAFGETPAELVSDFQQTFTYNLTFLGAVSILVWEYIITFDREVALVWSRKPNGASLLFFLNRYIMLVQFGVQLPLLFTISDKVSLSASTFCVSGRSFLPIHNDNRGMVLRRSCHRGIQPDVPASCLVLNRVLAVFSIAPYFVWAAFSTLRAYAMSNRSWPIAIVIFILSIIPTGYNIYNFARIIPINLPPPIYCIPTFPGITPTFIDQDNRHTRTAYFVILLTLNVLHIVVRKTAQENYITTFEEPLTSILISRFIMNLREVDYTDRNGTAADTDEGPSRLDFAERSHFANASQAATVRFVASFVDPLGTQLDYSGSDLDSDSVLEETLDDADGKVAPSGDRRGAAGDDDQVLADWARVDTVLQSLDQEHSAQESSASGQMSFAPRASYAR
ncbi:hypothetical protein C8Q76DRAFT_802626 [Earliella scabrosa]|nr:hypothetical protein C8Q76DRAFT_802626 [Earliella scabrosa]